MTRSKQCAAPAILPTGRPHGGRSHPDANVTVIRVWTPADGPDLLSEIVRSVSASGGTLLTRIPAVFITVEEFHAAGTRCAGQTNAVASITDSRQRRQVRLHGKRYRTRMT